MKPYRLAVKAVIANEAGETLLLRRSADNTSFVGCWEWPGGKVDPGEDFATAVVRETKEETGLDVEITGLAGTTAFAMPEVNVVLLCMETRITGGWTDEYKTTKLVMRRIPAGMFTMGSPEGELGRDSHEAQRQVTLTKDYYMGVFEVTQRQWELVMGNKPSYFNSASYYPTRPVERVSYYDIRNTTTDLDTPCPNMSEVGRYW